MNLADFLSSLLYNFIFIHSFLTALGLCCWAQAFSKYGEQGLLFLHGAGFPSQWILLLQSTALGAWVLAVAAQGL